jgi:hypothetical protein
MKIPDRAKKCPHCGLSPMAIGITQNRAGATVYPFFCDGCGEVTQQYASRAASAEYALHGPLREVMTKTARKVALGLAPAEIEKRIMPPCEVCGSTDKIEEHHWAPWHLFGEEAEKWPKSYLCQPCHVRWHQTVTPDMGKRKGLVS